MTARNGSFLLEGEGNLEAITIKPHINELALMDRDQSRRYGIVSMADSRSNTETPSLHGSELSEAERALILALRVLQMALRAVTDRTATPNTTQILQSRLGALSSDESRLIHVCRSGGSIVIVPDEYNLLGADNMTPSERAINRWLAGYATDEDTVQNTFTKRLRQIYGDLGERVDSLTDASKKRTEMLRRLQDSAINARRETENSVRETEQLLGIKIEP